MGKIRFAFAFGIAAWLVIKIYGLGTWTWEHPIKSACS